MSSEDLVERKASVAGRVSRRSVLIGLPAFLAACQAVDVTTVDPMRWRNQVARTELEAVYGAVPNEPFPIPAVNLAYVNPAYYRTRVLLPMNISGGPGDIIVDTQSRYLYYVEDEGTALRYGVGVGREGFGWSGAATIQRKAEWPTWTPPAEMVRRDPSAAPWANGMPGGLENPLGARALYLYQGGRDTLYRIHGTIEPWSIGTNVSSGCIRMINQDVIHLYNQVTIGTRVTVLA